MPRPTVSLVALSVAGVLTLAALAQTPPLPDPAVPPARLTAEQAAAEREKYVKEVRALIAGHEKEPAEKVFKDIQLLKGVPVGRLLAIMNLGYGRSLGVSCTHCHVPGEWEKSDKPQKEITRRMSRLAATINDELLPKIGDLDSQKPAVNCTTCHRGEIKPALDLRVAPPGALPAGAAKP